jgi:predicted Ser/Thr protein kinase
VTVSNGAPRAADTDTARLERWFRQERRRGRLLGRGYQASAWLHDSPVGPVVIKKPHDSAVVRLIGRHALRREAATYRRLEGIPGIPRCYGLIDDCLVLEFVDGPSLRRYEKGLEHPDRYFASLLATIDALHAAGVAHGDLKRKDNVLVGPGERPYVIDFGIAWVADADAPRWRRAVFDTVRQMDLNAWIKLKYRRDLARLTPEDAARHRPLLLERVARAIRIPWQKVTMRRLRQRLKRREG